MDIHRRITKVTDTVQDVSHTSGGCGYMDNRHSAMDKVWIIYGQAS